MGENMVIIENDTGNVTTASPEDRRRHLAKIEQEQPRGMLFFMRARNRQLQLQEKFFIAQADLVKAYIDAKKSERHLSNLDSILQAEDKKIQHSLEVEDMQRQVEMIEMKEKLAEAKNRTAKAGNKELQLSREDRHKKQLEEYDANMKQNSALRKRHATHIKNIKKNLNKDIKKYVKKTNREEGRVVDLKDESTWNDNDYQIINALRYAADEDIDNVKKSVLPDLHDAT